MTKNRYYQLTQEQRYAIEAYLKVGKNRTEISVLLGVHKSTISREMNRNVPKRGLGAKVYSAINAQKKTIHRHKIKKKRILFSEALIEQMCEWITIKRYSPELVAAQWVKDGIEGVSLETIYKFIWAAKHSNKRKVKKYKGLHKLLKHGKRRRKRGNYQDSRGLIPNRISIEKRPAIVEKRKRFGDFEVDLIMGSNHQSALLVTIDRSTLLTTIDKLEGKLNAKTYFTRPYTSQDKGTIENRNGVIRLFYPKKTDFNLVTKKDIVRVEKEINNRPVRKFGYLTPIEVYSPSA
jgi:IS30 family transposase